MLKNTVCRKRIENTSGPLGSCVKALFYSAPLARFSKTPFPHVEYKRNMKQTAVGSFDVKLSPLDIEGEMMGRFHIDKTFHGPLNATSLGQMLSAGTTTKGSAVYVAIERVQGTLDGRTGSFVLHHSGIMDRNQPTLSIAVVPDSGTAELTGLTGTMLITIENGKHSYHFEYLIPDTNSIY